MELSKLRSATMRGGDSMINTKFILSKMALIGLKQKDIAGPEIWDCAEPTVSQKLHGARPVSVAEANALARALKFSQREYYKAFFDAM